MYFTLNYHKPSKQPQNRITGHYHIDFPKIKYILIISNVKACFLTYLYVKKHASI